MAAYINNGHANLQTYGKSVVEGIGKYKDIYEQGATDTQELNYGKAANKYGDAIYETSNGYSDSSASWHKDYVNFTNNSYPFFFRGGRDTYTTNAGTFSFGRTTGENSIYDGFRLTIPII